MESKMNLFNMFNCKDIEKMTNDENTVMQQQGIW